MVKLSLNTVYLIANNILRSALRLGYLFAAHASNQFRDNS